MVKVSKTKLDKVLFIEPGVFEYFRGQHVETYDGKIYKEKGTDVKFVQDNISVSFKSYEELKSFLKSLKDSDIEAYRKNILVFLPRRNSSLLSRNILSRPS